MGRHPVEQYCPITHGAHRFLKVVFVQGARGKDRGEHGSRPFRFKMTAPQGDRTLGGVGDDDHFILCREREGEVTLRFVVMDDERSIPGRCGFELPKIHPERLPREASCLQDSRHVGEVHRQIAGGKLVREKLLGQGCLLRFYAPKSVHEEGQGRQAAGSVIALFGAVCKTQRLPVGGFGYDKEKNREF